MHNQRKSRKQFRTPLAGTGLTAAAARALPRRWGASPAPLLPWKKARRSAFWAVNPTVDSTLGLTLVLAYEPELTLNLQYQTELELALQG